MVSAEEIGAEELDEALSSVDVVLATEAVRALLKAFGMGSNDEVMRNTPRRVVEAYRELLTPPTFEFRTFPNQRRYDELVFVGAVPFRSICEHHFLPFSGEAYIGYVPDGEVAGLSKLARAVELWARRPQLQERLTTDVADWLTERLSARGVAGSGTPQNSSGPPR